MRSPLSMGHSLDIKRFEVGLGRPRVFDNGLKLAQKYFAGALGVKNEIRIHCILTLHISYSTSQWLGMNGDAYWMHEAYGLNWGKKHLILSLQFSKFINISNQNL